MVPENMDLVEISVFPLIKAFVACSDSFLSNLETTDDGLRHW